jgi:hypothetical protein
MNYLPELALSLDPPTYNLSLPRSLDYRREPLVPETNDFWNESWQFGSSDRVPASPEQSPEHLLDNFE